MTHFEATLTLLGIVIGMLSTLIAVVWRVRGYVDRLNSTDSALARAIEDMARTQRELHEANQKRFAAIERKLS